MRAEIDSAKWTGHAGIRGVSVIVDRPGLYIAFHWQVFLTAFHRRGWVSLALAGWPLGTLEVSFPPKY